MESKDTTVNPTVSITVITYNQCNYVRQAIEGGIRQKCGYSTELLISDDASTDGTAEILLEYKKKYPEWIHLTIQKENVGATKNSYGNYIKATGKYIASLEGDDYWLDPFYLEKGISFLEKHTEYVAVAYKSRIIDSCGREIHEEQIDTSKRFWEFAGHEFTMAEFCEWKMPGQMSAMIFRNVFLDLSQDECSALYQLDHTVGDRTILMFLVSRGKICCMDNVTSAYRYHLDDENGGYMSRMHTQNLRFQEYRYMSDIEMFARKHYGNAWNLKKVRKNKLAGAASVYLSRPTKENAAVLNNIICYSREPVKSRLFVLSVWIYKIFCKYILKEDRRFPV